MGKIKTVVFRTPYYELGDAIQRFKAVAIQKKDAKLKSKAI